MTPPGIPPTPAAGLEFDLPPDWVHAPVESIVDGRCVDLAGEARDAARRLAAAGARSLLLRPPSRADELAIVGALFVCPPLETDAATLLGALADRGEAAATGCLDGIDMLAVVRRVRLDAGGSPTDRPTGLAALTVAYLLFFPDVSVLVSFFAVEIVSSDQVIDRIARLMSNVRIIRACAANFEESVITAEGRGKKGSPG